MNRLLLRYRREAEPDTNVSPEELLLRNVEQLIDRGSWESPYTIQSSFLLVK